MESCLLTKRRSALRRHEPQTGLIAELQEPVTAMLTERHKWPIHEVDSMDAQHRDGASRSSVEGAVMALEQRGCVIQLLSLINRKGGIENNDEVN